MKNVLCIFLAIAVLALAQTGVSIINQKGTPVLGQNYNSGMVALTNSAATLTASSLAVKILHCANTTAGAITLTITDNAGSPLTYWPTVSVAANSVLVANYGDPGLIMAGIKWNASANTSMNCQVEGILQ